MTIPIQGGIEDGLPDVIVKPDLSTLAPLPWEPGVMHCLGDTFLADGTPAPESPRTVVTPGGGAPRAAESAGRRRTGTRVLHLRALRGYGTTPTGFKRYADSPGNVYVVGRKGDPNGLLLRTLRYLRAAGLQVTAANHEYCAGQFEVNLNHSDLVDAADRAFRMKSAVQEITRHEGTARHVHGQAVQRRGRVRFPPAPVAGRRVAGQRVRRPRRRVRAVRHRQARHRRRAAARPGGRGPGQPHDQLLQALRPGHPGPLADRLGPGQPQRDGPHPARAGTGRPHGGPAGRRHREPVPDRRGHRPPPPTSASGTRPNSPPRSRGTATTRRPPPCSRRPCPPPSTRWPPTPPSTEVLGSYFVGSFLAYKRNEVERFERFVTDWEFREYAYHL